MSQVYREKIAQLVKSLREKKKMTRENLSLALGYDNSYISKLERGNVNITIDGIEEIAKFFGVDINIKIK
ncbi:helix-turn-helix transcriptional regulator [bacterium]|nr:helix-turn-helix transcriptional regulator [bacterium]